MGRQCTSQPTESQVPDWSVQGKRGGPWSSGQGCWPETAWPSDGVTASSDCAKRQMFACDHRVKKWLLRNPWRLHGSDGLRDAPSQGTAPGGMGKGGALQSASPRGKALRGRELPPKGHIFHLLQLLTSLRSAPLVQSSTRLF